MTTTAPRPVLSMTRQEARLLGRDPGIVAWAVAVPLVANAVLTLIPGLRTAQTVLGGLSWAQVYLPTITVFTLSILGVQVLPTTLAQYRQDGILRRLRTTPVSPAALLAATCLVLSAVGVGVTALLMVTPVAAGVGLPGAVFAFALTALATLACMVAMGALIAAVARTARIATGVGVCVTPFLWFAAGMWVPLPVMPDWLARVCELLPTGAAAKAMQAAMFGHWPTLTQWLVPVAWGLGCGVLAARWFRWE